MTSALPDLLRVKCSCPDRISLPLYQWKIFSWLKVCKTPWSNQIWKTDQRFLRKTGLLYNSLPTLNHPLSIWRPSLSYWYKEEIILHFLHFFPPSIPVVHSSCLMKQRCLQRLCLTRKQMQLIQFLCTTLTLLWEHYFRTGGHDPTQYYTVQHKSTCVTFLAWSRRTPRCLDT